MSIWIVIYNSLIQDICYTGEIIVEKAFLSKDAAEAWINQQEYWWEYKARELPVQE